MIGFRVVDPATGSAGVVLKVCEPGLVAFLAGCKVKPGFVRVMVEVTKPKKHHKKEDVSFWDVGERG